MPHGCHLIPCQRGEEDEQVEAEEGEAHPAHKLNGETAGLVSTIVLPFAGRHAVRHVILELIRKKEQRYGHAHPQHLKEHVAHFSEVFGLNAGFPTWHAEETAARGAGTAQS